MPGTARAREIPQPVETQQARISEPAELQEEIRLRAYQIYLDRLQSGGPAKSELDDWTEAEAAIRRERETLDPSR